MYDFALVILMGLALFKVVDLVEGFVPQLPPQIPAPIPSCSVACPHT